VNCLAPRSAACALWGIIEVKGDRFMAKGMDRKKETKKPKKDKK
jgi:hypothetical protein